MPNPDSSEAQPSRTTNPQHNRPPVYWSGRGYIPAFGELVPFIPPGQNYFPPPSDPVVPPTLPTPPPRDITPQTIRPAITPHVPTPIYPQGLSGSHQAPATHNMSNNPLAFLAAAPLESHHHYHRNPPAFVQRTIDGRYYHHYHPYHRSLFLARSHDNLPVLVPIAPIPQPAQLFNPQTSHPPHAITSAHYQGPPFNPAHQDPLANNAPGFFPPAYAAAAAAAAAPPEAQPQIADPTRKPPKRRSSRIRGHTNDENNANAYTPPGMCNPSPIPTPARPLSPLTGLEHLAQPHHDQYPTSLLFAPTPPLASTSPRLVGQDVSSPSESKHPRRPTT